MYIYTHYRNTFSISDRIDRLLKDENSKKKKTKSLKKSSNGSPAVLIEVSLPAEALVGGACEQPEAFHLLFVEEAP